MRDIALLDMDIRAPERSDHGDRVDCYALDRTDLSRYALLVVPATVDQEHLARHRHVIRDYLDEGGVLLFGGQLHRDWLPGASSFVPLPRPSLDAYRVAWIADHPIFAGVEPDDLTFRRGVAGFFARGHHPLPPGAEVLVRLAGGEPATYVDRTSTRGTILVHASGDLLGYDRADGTSSRLSGQLIDWARAEARARRAELPAAPSPAPAAAPRDPLSSRSDRGLAAVYGGSAPHHRALTTPKYAQHLAGGLRYLPELAETDLTGLDGLIIPERLHHDTLNAAAGRVSDLLDAGGTVIAFTGGEPVPEFLPGVRWEHRPTNFWWWLEPGADLGLRTPDPEHPLFDHLTLRDCTWHYHGVLTPPDGAEVLVTLPTGEALLYVDRVSTPGTLVVATLDPMHHYGSHFMPATERFLDGFLPWVAAEATR
ncbi:hypothetical protein K1T35_09865 [Pseudonocardia sp. DSM 110487]|uniref:hypothetical protein n=1 Tax=Pseudonocardia sp. DSM 110487 TaxID=2865833 RepID=UPI001C6998A7|nr:hypothetical protein [Pseudonocardia sp. DSM 110487]QYN37511.1 hypothetical protein K1T35_09865 [Pseudonocardia sp. DSM 110487]